MGESVSMDTSFPWIENEKLSVAIYKTYVQMKADGIHSYCESWRGKYG